MFVDTHCHLNDATFAGRLTAILARAATAGVRRFIVPGVGHDSWDTIMALTGSDDRIFAAPGIHPLRSGEFREPLLDRLQKLAVGAVAVGEIGLDYSYEIPREIQQKAFREQLRLAVRMNLPVILHCRRAFADLLKTLREERVESVGGVMHAFSGSPDTAEHCIRLGLSIGVAGPVTYDNALKPVEVVRRIPLQHLLLETDAPDLAPVPYRGTLCEPSYLLETARKVAAIKGVTVDEVSQVTTANAEGLFRLQLWAPRSSPPGSST